MTKLIAIAAAALLGVWLVQTVVFLASVRSTGRGQRARSTP
jgi:hypothetical protein